MPTTLPEAVQRQLDEADQLEQSLTQPAPQGPADPPADPPEPPPAPAPSSEPPVEDWEQKYKTLQGKYNAEVPPLRDQVRTLTQQVEKLSAQPPAPAPKPVTPAEKLVTPKDTEAFGEDLVDLIRRAAREESAAEKADLLAQIDEMKAKLPTLTTQVETVASVQDGDRRARYYAELEAAVPDYAAVNENEDFLSWLANSDPFSGAVRDNILKGAFDAFDVKRTATIFDTWKAEAGLVTPPPPPVPPAPDTRQEELAAQVSPGTSKNSASVAVDGGRVWTADEVQKFYSGITKGEYRGREAEMQRIEAEIDTAVAEGRFRG